MLKLTNNRLTRSGESPLLFFTMVKREDYLSEQGTWNGSYDTISTGDVLRDADLPWLSRVWNDLTGQTSQEREFAQQEYFQDKMNEYNHPVEEMKRQKEAGVNPNLAAAGIANAGSQSAQAPQVPSNTSGVAEGVSAASSLASSIGNLSLVDSQKKLNEASAKEADANADSTQELTPVRKKEILANALKIMMDAKVSKHQGTYWAAKALYASSQERMDLMGKLYNIRKVNEERKKIHEETKVIKKQLEIMKEQLSQEEFRTRIVEIEKNKAERLDAVLQKYGVDITMPENGMALEAAEAGTLDVITDVFEKVEEAKSLGDYKAQIATIEEKTRKEQQEILKARVQELFANEQFQKDLIKFGVTSKVRDTIYQSLLHYLFGTGMSVSIRGIGITNNEPRR